MSLVLAATMLTMCAFAVVPVVARAATPAPNYTLGPITYAGGTAVQNCRGWGADADAAGNFYMACPVMRDLDGNGTGDATAPALYEMDPTGKVLRLGYLPSEYVFNDRYHIRDVGVSPDGTTAYVSTGPVTDNLGQHPEYRPGTSETLPNGATQGSVLRLKRQADGSWLHDPSFKAGPYLLGGNYWSVRFVDVDAAGHVYVTVNAYVYEIDPATGATISAFGGAQTASPGGPWVDGFEVPEGIAVSPDGQSILIVEQRHQIVQRWTRVGATDWVRDRGFLLGVPDAVGDYCGTTTHFQSPYDVSVDIAGDIYVMDTTCQRIQRFTSTGAFIQTIWSNVGGDDLNHGIAVNWQGSVLLPIEEDVLVRLDPPTKPAEPEAPKPPTAPAARTVRPVVNFAGAGCSRIAPLRRITSPTRFRVVDRCAKLTGRVTGVKKTRTGYRVQLVLPLATARRLFAGATGPVRIDVLTDRRTRILRTVRTGRSASVVASIVASRDLTTAWAMPTDAIAGR